MAQLPRGGEIVMFDRSWYNRAVVETILGCAFSTEAGVRGAALRLLRTLAGAPQVCHHLASQAPATALLALLRMDVDCRKAVALAISLDILRSARLLPSLLSHARRSFRIPSAKAHCGGRELPRPLWQERHH